MAFQDLVSDSQSYEPSQPLAMLEGLETKSRTLRSSHAGTRRTSALFQPGGALDSQTSDSQWASSFTHDAALDEEHGDLLDASVATDQSSFKDLDDSTCCAQARDDADALREELAHVEAFYQKELARVEAAYAGVVAHLESVRAALDDEPIILDPTEQSQKILTPRRVYRNRSYAAYASPSPAVSSPPAYASSPAVHASSPPHARASLPSCAARSPQSVKGSLLRTKRRRRTAITKTPAPSLAIPGPSMPAKVPQITPMMVHRSPSGMSRPRQSKIYSGKKMGGSTCEEVIVLSSSEAEEVPSVMVSAPSVKRRRF